VRSFRFSSPGVEVALEEPHLPTTVSYPTFPTCYVCGSDNPLGLHVPFTPAPDGTARAEYTAREEHVGWPDRLHGGIMFTLMDEALAWALCYTGLRGVTAKAETRFREPVRVGDRLVVTARIIEQDRKIVRARAELRTAVDDQLVAELNATMFVTAPEPAE